MASQLTIENTQFILTTLKTLYQKLTMNHVNKSRFPSADKKPSVMKSFRKIMFVESLPIDEFRKDGLIYRKQIFTCCLRAIGQLNRNNPQRRKNRKRICYLNVIQKMSLMNSKYLQDLTGSLAK